MKLRNVKGTNALFNSTVTEVKPLHQTRFMIRSIQYISYNNNIINVVSSPHCTCVDLKEVSWFLAALRCAASWQTTLGRPPTAAHRHQDDDRGPAPSPSRYRSAHQPTFGPAPALPAYGTHALSRPVDPGTMRRKSCPHSFDSG